MLTSLDYTESRLLPNSQITPEPLDFFGTSGTHLKYSDMSRRYSGAVHELKPMSKTPLSSQLSNAVH